MIKEHSLSQSFTDHGYNQYIPTLAVYPQEFGHQQYLGQVLCILREQTQQIIWQFVNMGIKLDRSAYICGVFFHCVFTPEVPPPPLTLCLSGLQIWGFAGSRSHVHNSSSASPSDCLQLYTQKTQLFSILSNQNIYSASPRDLLGLLPSWTHMFFKNRNSANQSVK